jgi:3-methyladenine DNA glycosylase Tag
MTILLNKMDEAKIDYKSSHLNADSGFDVKSFIEIIEEKHKIIANIPKNQRNTKKINQEHRYLSEYIYSFRFKIYSNKIGMR